MDGTTVFAIGLLVLGAVVTSGSAGAQTSASCTSAVAPTATSGFQRGDARIPPMIRQAWVQPGGDPRIPMMIRPMGQGTDQNGCNPQRQEPVAGQLASPASNGGGGNQAGVVNPTTTAPSFHAPGSQGAAVVNPGTVNSWSGSTGYSGAGAAGSTYGTRPNLFPDR